MSGCDAIADVEFALADNLWVMTSYEWPWIAGAERDLSSPTLPPLGVADSETAPPYDEIAGSRKWYASTSIGQGIQTSQVTFDPWPKRWELTSGRP